MSSKTEILNRAILLIGEPGVTDIESNVKIARNANQLYDQTRKAVFRAHPWNCLKKRLSLSLTQTTPAFGWDYQFDLPGDYIRMLCVEDDLPYSIEGKFLLSNYDTFKIAYVCNELDTTVYDPLLLDAFATRLAVDLAPSITHDVAKLKELLELYTMKLSEARLVNAQDRHGDEFESDTWIDSRVV